MSVHAPRSNVFLNPQVPKDLEFSSAWHPLSTQRLTPASIYCLVLKRSLLGREMTCLAELAAMRPDGSRHSPRDLATLSLLGLFLSDADKLGVENPGSSHRGQLFLEPLYSPTGTLVALRLYKFFFDNSFSESRTWHAALQNNARRHKRARKEKTEDGNAVDPELYSTRVQDTATLLSCMHAYSPEFGLASGRIEALLRRVTGNPNSVSLVQPLKIAGFYHVASPCVHLILHRQSFLANVDEDEVCLGQCRPGNYLVSRGCKRAREGDRLEPVQEEHLGFFALTEGSSCLAAGLDAFRAPLPIALQRRIKTMPGLGPQWAKRVKFEPLAPPGGGAAPSGSSTTTAE